MIETIIELRRIDPSPGMKLTDGKDIADNEIYLGNKDSVKNWYEITEAEAEALTQMTEAEPSQLEEISEYEPTE